MRNVTFGPCNIVFDMIRLRGFDVSRLAPWTKECFQDFIRTTRERAQTFLADDIEGVFIIANCGQLIHLAYKWNGERVTHLAIVDMKDLPPAAI